MKSMVSGIAIGHEPALRIGVRQTRGLIVVPVKLATGVSFPQGEPPNTKGRNDIIQQ